jgi:D-3-phosphoglycerate dehydrogenase / 2-oxoglutarate reductase
MKIAIPDKVSKTAAKIFTENSLAVEQTPGIAVDKIPKDADAIVVRSYELHNLAMDESLKAIGRAGAGVNNIPIEKCTESGVVVFNTPGANANAVKELVICSLLLASRDIVAGVNWTSSQKESGDKIPELVESNKKQFAGTEIMGKCLGVIGLGAIGTPVANAASALGMRVIGYDPYISVENAWKVSTTVEKADSLDHLLAKSDYITLHVPLTSTTKGIINKGMLAKMKHGVKLLNFSRGELVSSEDLKKALESGKVGKYITDFPSADVLEAKNVVCVPHLGASTEEAEENCAVMISYQFVDFLKNGNIVNSVNFPSCKLDRNGTQRITIVNRNIPGMIEKITEIFAEEKLNIAEMLNKSKDKIAYNIFDIDGNVSDAVIRKLEAVEGVIKARKL